MLLPTKRCIIIIADLDDFDLGEISRSLQSFSVAEKIEAVAHDTNGLIFTRGSRTSQVGKTSDELGHLQCHQEQPKAADRDNCSCFRK